MSNLTDLYISASYYGVVNLSDATEPFASQSEAKIYLQDGLGENLGIWFNSEKRVNIDNGLTVTGSTILSGSVDIIGNKTITGSLSVDGTISSSTHIYAPSASFDTINARLIHTTIESSSIIYSSGSNQLGDEPSDVQILSGSVYVPNLHYLAGNAKDTNLRIDEKVFTSSFQNYTSSTDQRLDSIELFTSSLEVDFVTDTELSAALEVVTSSLYTYIDNQDAKKLDTGSYLTDSASFDTRIDSKVSTSTYNSYVSLNDSKVNELISETGSYARLAGGNTFTGTQTINDTLYVNGDIQAFNGNLYSVNSSTISFTGSMDLTGSFEISGSTTITGSVNGNVEPIIISSLTASIDCSKGNFFTVTLPTGSNTHFTATNIIPGQTISIKVQTNFNTTASVDSNSIKMLGSAGYIPTQIGTTDILTFVSFDTSSLYGVAGSFFG